MLCEPLKYFIQTKATVTFIRHKVGYTTQNVDV